MKEIKDGDMNWTIQYLQDQHYARVKIEGKFNVDVHLRNIEEITVQENWKPGFNLLFDCRNADFTSSRFQDVRDLADNFIKNDLLVGDGKIAFLMKSVIDFGKGRQFEMLTDEQISANVYIFLSEEQALRWLKSERFKRN
jgi:hypothetical protein